MNELEKLPCCGLRACTVCGRSNQDWIVENFGCAGCIDGSAVPLSEIASAARAVDEAKWTNAGEKLATQNRLTDALERWDAYRRHMAKLAKRRSS